MVESNDGNANESALAVENRSMFNTSLRYFMSVARHQSIRAASIELNIAQSAVSRRLQALELDLGTDLFERRPRGVVLTQAGELLYAHCKNTSFEIDRLLSEINDLRGLRRGMVRIASIESMVPSVLSTSIAEFLKIYPGVKFSVQIDTSDHVIEAVQKGNADMGLTFLGPLESGTAFYHDIKAVYSAREPLMAAMHPSHPLAQKSRIEIQDLTNTALALATRKALSRIMFEQACARADISLQPALETNSVVVMLNFARSGTGVTLMLPHTAIDALAEGQLKVVPVNVASFSSTLSVIKLRERKLPLAAERFLETICLELRSLPGAAAPAE